MQVKTKKYQLPKKLYTKIAMINIWRKNWWHLVLPIVALLIGAVIFPKYLWWFLTPALLWLFGYTLFWIIQFTGVTQLQQSQVLFEKFTYMIDSRQILMMIDAQRGTPINWDMIKFAYREPDHFLLIMNKAQFIYLPYTIFNSDVDARFVETLLVRKNFIKERPNPAEPLKKVGEANKAATKETNNKKKK